MDSGSGCSDQSREKRAHVGGHGKPVWQGFPHAVVILPGESECQVSGTQFLTIRLVDI